MIDLKVQILGLKDVEEALITAGPKLAKRSLYKALKAGSDVFVQRAKDRAPVLMEEMPERRPNELRDAIASQITMSRKQESGIARTGIKHDQPNVQESPAAYGLFVEYGSVHNLAKPYMRPAWDEGKEEAARVFTEEIRRGVESLSR